MCPWSSHGLLKALPQSLHLQGSVWVRMCILRAPRLTYTLSQCLQLKVFFAVDSSLAEQWNCWCLERPEYVEYDLLQKLHWYLGDVSLERFLEGQEPLLPTLPGEDRSSGVGGGWAYTVLWLIELMELVEEVGERPQSGNGRYSGRGCGRAGRNC